MQQGGSTGGAVNRLRYGNDPGYLIPGAWKSVCVRHVKEQPFSDTVAVPNRPENFRNWEETPAACAPSVFCLAECHTETVCSNAGKYSPQVAHLVKEPVDQVPSFQRANPTVLSRATRVVARSRKPRHALLATMCRPLGLDSSPPESGAAAVIDQSGQKRPATRDFCGDSASSGQSAFQRRSARH